MVMTINIGNTNIAIGVFKDEQLLFDSKITTDRNKLTDEYTILIDCILKMYSVNNLEIKGAIISSVVPKLSGIIQKAVKKLIGKNPLIVGPGIKTGLNIRIDTPSILGTDIVASAVAANSLYPSPVIFFDIGSAAAVASVVENGCVLNGSIIIPGIRASLDALSTSASQLQEVSLEEPKDLLGKNTVDAMRAGAIYGWASIIDGIAERLEEKIGTPCTVVVTGRLSNILIPHCKKELIYNEYLLLTGLNIIYNKNI